MPGHSSPLETAQTAFDRFSHGLATGNWNDFLALLTEDFTFWFPAGAFQGKNVGKARAAEFFQRVSEVFAPGLNLTVERMTQSDTTIVFEVKSKGWMLGQPYENQAAISFDVRDGLICGYREYLGVVYQLPSAVNPQSE